MAENAPLRGVSPMLWFALALPILVYIGAIGLAEAKHQGAPPVEVAIEGQDPRDLLRGHYLLYRISAENAEGSHEYGASACVVGPQQGRRTVYLYDAARPNACEFELPADFVRATHRYYVQQDRAQKLEDAVRQGRASVRLRLVSEREVMVEELLIDGEPVR